ncbi:MAG TPA: serine hydrolase [Coleofasciculaceae cyanobacterium]
MNPLVLLFPLLLTAPQPIAQLPPTMSPTPSSISAQAALERLFTAPQLQPEWFAKSFLNQIPLSQIQTIIAGFPASLGTYQGVQKSGEAYQVIFEQGKLSAQITLNSSGQIAGILFKPQSNAIAPADAIHQLRQLPGQVNLLVLKNQAELAALNADQPLAVGSTFKLAVLVALRQQIEAGQRTWADVVELQAADKSLPSGILQTWYDGALLTVQTLATLMISVSDNTATDTLIHLVGRESIEALTARNRPFLTTRELFTLKAPDNAVLLQRYAASNEVQRRTLLQQINQLPLSGEVFADGQPVASDSVEWFFTPRELCSLMQQTADLPLMGVNPSSNVNPADWAQVAYKGGSEPGVLNQTTWLQAKDGTTYCITATWNHDTAALDEMQFYSIYSGIIEGLKAGLNSP